MQEIGDAFEKTAGSAAVEDAVVEAEGEFGFGDRDELLYFLAPMGDFAAGTEAENEVLLGQRNGRGPDDAEGAEVGDGGDAGTIDVVGKAAGAGLLDEFVVGGHQFDERSLFDFAQRGDHDAVIDFDSEADVDGERMHDAIADKASSEGGVFSQS